ncbi:MAG: M23 family metallopeptidase [Gemmataceae bacterium]|nr:M23 family metallopeptidase [Gemmataceae bacterium]
MADVVDPFLELTDGWTFPLKKLYCGRTWLKWGCKFAASRSDGKRAHAGCDLLSPLGTPILAIAAGTVLRVEAAFTDKPGFITDALVIDHDTYIIRYGEIEPGSAVNSKGKKLRAGDTVEQGEQIARIGNVGSDRMLHFEIYYGDAEGKLSNKKNTGDSALYSYVPKRNYQRRSDLMDPTTFLDKMANNSGL